MSNVFQICLKGFKLKKLVVEPKTTQPVELNVEPIDPKLNRSRSKKKPSLSFKTVVQSIEVKPQSVEVEP